MESSSLVSWSRGAALVCQMAFTGTSLVQQKSEATDGPAVCVFCLCILCRCCHAVCPPVVEKLSYSKASSMATNDQSGHGPSSCVT